MLKSCEIRYVYSQIGEGWIPLAILAAYDGCDGLQVAYACPSDPKIKTSIPMLARIFKNLPSGIGRIMADAIEAMGPGKNDLLEIVKMREQARICAQDPVIHSMLGITFLDIRAFARTQYFWRVASHPHYAGSAAEPTIVRLQ